MAAIARSILATNLALPTLLARSSLRAGNASTAAVPSFPNWLIAKLLAMSWSDFRLSMRSGTRSASTTASPAGRVAVAPSSQPVRPPISRPVVRSYISCFKTIIPPWF